MSHPPYKLHLGCGSDIREGWINIDISVPERENTIQHDLSKGLPQFCYENPIRLIYSSHLFEHFLPETANSLFRECYKSLSPGGVFRISLPNFKALVRAYLDNDREYLATPANLAFAPHGNLLEVVNYGLYQHVDLDRGHKWMYDEDLLSLYLKDAGFTDIKSVEFNSLYDPSDPARKKYSFYMEAKKA